MCGCSSVCAGALRAPAGTGVRELPDMGAELKSSGPAASHFSSLITLLKLINLFNVHWCFVYMHVCVRALDSLELDLQTVVSCHEGAGIEPRSTERAARALSHPFSPTPIITFNRLFYQEPCLLCSEKFRLATEVEQKDTFVDEDKVSLAQLEGGDCGCFLIQ